MKTDNDLQLPLFVSSTLYTKWQQWIDSRNFHKAFIDTLVALGWTKEAAGAECYVWTWDHGKGEQYK